MKHSNTIVLLAALTTPLSHAFTQKSFMTYRSQGQNLARQVAGWQNLRTQIFNGDDRGNVSLAVEYTRSFNASAISKYFFGCDCMTFSGSRVAYRGAGDIMADYFGLPTDFQSTVCFNPRVQNVIADLDFYWNLDCLIKGFNLHLNIPVAYTKWALNPCETVIDPGTAPYPAGYMSNAVMTRDMLKNAALDILSGGAPIGDITYPLQFGRISPCAQRTTKIADILVALGYTFVRDRNWLIGANLQVIVPTGTRSQACTIFEPQVGNGHHWALGGGLTARYDIIDNQERDLKLSACLDASIQHLFKTTENRSYDLKNNGPGGRYILLEDMVGGISMAQGFNSTTFPTTQPLDNQYITRLIYAINTTTLLSRIKINVQADIVAKLTMDYRNWNFDLGYNFWGRSHETLVDRQCFNHKFYGVKGDAQVYGFFPIGPAGYLSIPANATQSHATLHAGQGEGNTTHNFINANADNATLMYNAMAPMFQTSTVTADSGITAIQQINGSNQAIILSDADINNCSGLSPRALSNKIFGSAAYTWRDCNHVTPYISLGAEGEFAGNDDCVKTAISQWGVWLKGGFNY